MDTTKRARTLRKKEQDNGQLDPRRIRTLKRQYRAVETEPERAEFMASLQSEERRQLRLALYRALRTDKDRERFLLALSSAELHTLMWDLTYDSHQRGRRLA